MLGPDPVGDETPQDRATGRNGAATASIGDLLSHLVRDLTGLVRSETRLVRTEIAEAAQSVALGVEVMAAGGMVLLIAGFVLVQAGIIALAHYIGPMWASVIAGGVLASVGLLLIWRGRHIVASARLIPERTLEQTSRDIRLAKEQM